MTNTTHIYNLDELQDRRIMMDKKLPPYGYALIILTGFLMVYLLLWSTKNYRTYVSQSTGTVQAAKLCQRGRPHCPHQEHRPGHSDRELREPAGPLQKAEEPVREAGQVHPGRQKLLQRDGH